MEVFANRIVRNEKEFYLGSNSFDRNNTCPIKLDSIVLRRWRSVFVIHHVFRRYHSQKKVPKSFSSSLTNTLVLLKSTTTWREPLPNLTISCPRQIYDQFQCYRIDISYVQTLRLHNLKIHTRAKQGCWAWSSLIFTNLFLRSIRVLFRFSNSVHVQNNGVVTV